MVMSGERRPGVPACSVGLGRWCEAELGTPHIISETVRQPTRLRSTNAAQTPYRTPCAANRAHVH